MMVEPAMRLAREFGCVLPTQKITDAICTQAGAKALPVSLPNMELRKAGNYYLALQNEEKALFEQFPDGTLFAGHRKDLVLTEKSRNPLRNGTLYQSCVQKNKPVNLNYLMEGNYPEHTAGVRLMSRKVLINGQEKDIGEVLNDPVYAQLLAYEGSFSPEGKPF